MTSKYRQSPREKLISKHFIPELSNIINSYSSEALEWYTDLSFDAKYPEDYPTQKCLDKYLLQLIRDHNDNTFIQLMVSPWNIVFPSLSVPLTSSHVIFHGSKVSFDYLHGDLSGVDFMGNLELLVKNEFDEVILTGISEFHEDINERQLISVIIDFIYALSLIYKRNMISEYIERYFGNRGRAAYRAYLGDISGTLSDINKISGNIGVFKLDNRTDLMTLVIHILVYFDKYNDLDRLALLANLSPEEKKDFWENVFARAVLCGKIEYLRSREKELKEFLETDDFLGNRQLSQVISRGYFTTFQILNKNSPIKFPLEENIFFRAVARIILESDLSNAVAVYELYDLPNIKKHPIKNRLITAEKLLECSLVYSNYKMFYDIYKNTYRKVPVDPETKEHYEIDYAPLLDAVVDCNSTEVFDFLVEQMERMKVHVTVSEELLNKAKKNKNQVIVKMLQTMI